MATTRKYSYSDIDMLMASKVVAKNFLDNIPELSTVRTDWNKSYAVQLISKIDHAIDEYLGVDAQKELRKATETVTKIQAPAKRDLSFFKTQIVDDFSREPQKRDEILRILGFTEHLRGVQKNQQQPLIELLQAFKKNMTLGLEKEIASKGLNPKLIKNIIGYADSLIEANVSQESLKESTKEITDEIVGAFNSIYKEVIGICKKAAKYYQYEPLKKEQFTFIKAVNNLGAAKNISEVRG